MKTITLLHLRNTLLTLLICTATNFQLLSQTIIHSANFETGNNGWNLAYRCDRNNTAGRSYQGNWNLRVFRNGNAFSPGLTLSAYDKIDFKFYFTARSMETGERFYIDYRPDSGASWTEIGNFLSGNVPSKTADFQNGTTIIFYSKTVTIFKTDHFFPSSATAQFRIRNSGNEDNDELHFDNITITGTTFQTPSVAPGGVTDDLDLWLKADKVNGSGILPNNAPINKWHDNGKGNHAETVVSYQAPVYKHNVTRNFNFNPVIEFENNNNTSWRDMTYLNNRQELKGTGGFNSNDVFVVLMPDPVITTTMIPLDTFTSTDPTGNTYTEDVTGFGYGSFTQRFYNERLTYCIGTTNEGGDGSDYPGNGYGRADTNSGTNYNQIGIVNFRHNSSNDNMHLYFNAVDVGNEDNSPAQFAEIRNTRYWLGRSQYWDGSYDGRIAEVISYTATNNDTDNTRERNRIQSYLAVKYGITLGLNGTSQDYADSDGSIIWDASAGSYNYDIAGIGRDDASELEQKQSRSVNDATDGIGRTQGILTVGLTDIYETNYDNKTLNSTTLNDKEFLMWGDNGADLNAAAATITVDMSAGIPGLSTEVSFTAMQRIWKFVETGGDVPTVKVSIPQNAVRNINPPGSYYMFISDTGVFDPTAAYTLMVDDGNGNLETTYDFDGTKYITFGYAPQIEVVRSIYFNGTSDFVDMEDKLNLNPSGFTISAWINRDPTDAGRSVIVSKRNVGFTNGYELAILGDDRIRMRWFNGVNQNISSNTVIPRGEWHHVAVIYNGTEVSLYIDGVRDVSTSRIAPVPTNEYFYIAAGGKNNPENFFRGNIDEVRIWNRALTEAQLRFIMNQEIEQNASFTAGKVLPITITKYEIGSVPWSDLAAYYPMSVYTYTNTDDASGNGNQGALRNLRTVDRQTAPLPYISNSNADWNTADTWTNGTMQYIPGGVSLVNPNITIDWNIAKTSHNIVVDNSVLPTSKNGNRHLLSLEVESNTLTVAGDTKTNEGYGLTITHYLKLDGTIDLEGESQLIQTIDSDFDITSSGRLERDQQGTADRFTYNYWSSPVGLRNTTTNNNNYTLPTILRDGTNPITFISAGFNGTNTSPIGIADFWIWKFANQATGQYSAWQHVRSTGSILAGEGFTMKGPGTGAVIDDQNYVFTGKPNNGNINLTLAANSDYLVGNPYPSAIDADQFILDNGPVIGGTGALNGSLYFWEHWGGGSHILSEYQGGYGTYNLSGGAPSASQGITHPDVGMGGTPRKTPGRYIPVSQGFFVT
ncbi:LamG domain-containing protein, partial [Paucihalobacter sp.]|uniref:LamG domain-containing protein n=1 Tax=Paucihalobacter sp. TaxID=2850405 RepID=UPI002FE2B840